MAALTHRTNATMYVKDAKPGMQRQKGIYSTGDECINKQIYNRIIVSSLSEG
jgi:hypothetical protein